MSESLKVQRPQFCPRCHARVNLPAFLKGGNVNFGGKIAINCGNCKKGKIVIKTTAPPPQPTAEGV